MSFYYSDDPARDYDRYDTDRERRLARRPICERCREHIQVENLWDIDGTLYCPECARIEFERDTENYVED